MPRSPHLEKIVLGGSELGADGILCAGVGDRQALVVRHILIGHVTSRSNKNISFHEWLFYRSSFATVIVLKN